jgi:molybdopterin converting factor subunit 1
VKVHVRYFAWLREQTGMADELVETGARTAAELWRQLDSRHRFDADTGRLRVAINDAFADWDAPLSGGDRIVFIPPVSGG